MIEYIDDRVGVAILIAGETPEKGLGMLEQILQYTPAPENIVGG